MKRILMLLSTVLPWDMRRSILQNQFGYQIHPSCRIGFCWISPSRLIMEEGSRIDHLTLCKNIDLLHLKAHSSIGRGNWITGFPLGPSPHFAEEKDRQESSDSNLSRLIPIGVSWKTRSLAGSSLSLTRSFSTVLPKHEKKEGKKKSLTCTQSLLT